MDPRTQPRLGAFNTTHWSVVLAAAGTQSPQAGAALEYLCGAYWYPLYAYIRRRGHAPAEAQDLTQGFFERLLERRYLAAADRTKGKFRSFLLTALNHYLADEWDKARAAKRGGARPHVSFDAESAENHYILEPSQGSSPDKIFERAWALALLERVYGRLREEYIQGGKSALFEELKVHLAGDGRSVPYAVTGRKLGLSEGAVKVAVHRLRRRYRELLRAEITQTVARPDEVEEELRHLMVVLGAG